MKSLHLRPLCVRPNGHFCAAGFLTRVTDLLCDCSAYFRSRPQPQKIEKYHSTQEQCMVPLRSGGALPSPQARRPSCPTNTTAVHRRSILRTLAYSDGAACFGSPYHIIPTERYSAEASMTLEAACGRRWTEREGCQSSGEAHLTTPFSHHGRRASSLGMPRFLKTTIASARRQRRDV